jgi:hypothetical protein
MGNESKVTRTCSNCAAFSNGQCLNLVPFFAPTGEPAPPEPSNVCEEHETWAEYHASLVARESDLVEQFPGETHAERVADFNQYRDFCAAMARAGPIYNPPSSTAKRKPH